jgi:hypothetical protein
MAAGIRGVGSSTWWEKGGGDTPFLYSYFSFKIETFILVLLKAPDCFEQHCEKIKKIYIFGHNDGLPINFKKLIRLQR